jgi:uncharacterized protein with GYD domain
VIKVWARVGRVEGALGGGLMVTGQGTRVVRRLRRVKGDAMPTYVSLINWTDQGIKDFRESTQRAEDFSKLVESSGGTVRELLWTVGQYDVVSVVDFPDDETGVAALLQVSSMGNVRSNTLRAFGAEEMSGIIRRAG